MINSFDSADEVAGWYFENWSTAPATAEWDATVNSSGDPGSGSMKIVIDFDAANGKNDANFSRALPSPFNASRATLFIADVLVAEESPDTPWGDKGYMQFVTRTGDTWAWTAQLATNLSSDIDWLHFQGAPVAPVQDIRAFTFALWGGAEQKLHGQTTLWLDNLRFVGDFDSTVIGDTDGDHDVDLNDLNNVRNNFGAVDPASGDTDGDGDVDQDDLNAVRNNFGTAGSNSVPEPAAGILALAGMAAIGILRRRAR